MAKGDSPPEYQAPTDQRMLLGGGQAYDFATQLMKSGLPPELKQAITDQFQGQLGGQLKSGEQSLKENFASQGNAPVGSLIGGLVSQQANANNASKGFYTNLLSQDFSARQQGFNNLSALQSLLAGVSNQQNQYNLGKYQSDQQNQFNWGQLIGDAFGFGSKFIKP